MASYRPFPPPPPPQSTFPPQPPPPPSSQNPLPPPPQRPSQFSQNYPAMAPPPLQNYPPHQPHYPAPRGGSHHQQYPYQQQPPPPPPPESLYPPPPPPPPQQQQPPPPPPPSSMYYPGLQYSSYGHQGMQPPPPPPPSSPPPNSSVLPPPPPPPSSPPPPPPPKESGAGRDRERGRDRDHVVPRERRDHGEGFSRQHHQHKPPALPMPGKKVNVPPGRAETEEERRLRKKREYEKQRQEEKQKQHFKEKAALMMASNKGHGSIVGSRMGDRRASPLLTGERIENRLKKPTTFLCKLKFRNELPDPSAQPKLMSLKRDKDRFTRYTITSLEKTYKPQLYVEPDLGVPLDLLDLSVYNRPSVRLPLDPEDEELLRDDEVVTPVKREGIKRKERPTDKGVSWLVKTQYISPLSVESTKQSLTEKQAKDLREMKGGRNLLGDRNDRERQIKEIEATFRACKQIPVHATNKSLKAVEVMPLLPDFDRYDDKFVTVTFDNAPTAASASYSKLSRPVCDNCESKAVMKACVTTGSDSANPEQFLAYMVPVPNELSKDIYDESEDISYSWIREYHWDVRGDDANDPTTFLVSFDEAQARYLPLPTKISLKNKRAREGRAGDEVEHFPAPARVTLRNRPTAATFELKAFGANSNKGGASSSRMGKMDDDDDDDDDGLGRHHRVLNRDTDHSSGAEDDMSE